MPKSTRSKLNTQQLEEHDPGMIKKSLHCTTMFHLYLSD